MTLNIKAVVNSCLCTGCGGCVSICPRGAVKMQTNTASFLHAYIDESKCVHCGLCLRICPSNSDRIPPATESEISGGYISAFACHATDERLRAAGQSGGSVTALLKFMLDNSITNAALINTYNKGDDHPKIMSAQNDEELLKGCGSYYTQSAVASMDIRSDTAVVALGCQAEAIRSISEAKGLDTPLILGLFCEGQHSGWLYTALCKKAGTAPCEVSQFRYKSKKHGDWPGDIEIHTEKITKTLPSSERKKRKPVYECFRCLMCWDKLNVNCDIAFGDPWGVPEYQTRAGWNVALIRTERGQKLFSEAISSGVMIAEPLSPELIIQGAEADSRLLRRIKWTAEYCVKNGWRIPFQYKASATDGKAPKKLIRRIDHSRALYSATTISELRRLVSRRRFEVSLTRIKNRSLSAIAACKNNIKKRLFDEKA